MSSTYFYNTLTNKREVFIPINKDEVKMYTCGPTVYSYAHIGNFRTFIFEDLLRRYLKLKGYKVTQVMNITDVDDKTIRDSIAAGVSLTDYTKKYEDAFMNDLDTLRIEKAEYYPKATQHIEDMIELIKGLEEKGLTYERDGSTYFKISEFQGYGKLSNIDITNVKSGVRYDSDEYEKEDVRDFVLWKKTDKNSGEPTWDSPFGPGRPGWHLECSAMSMKYLGKTFDIHTGGVDNIFPHHENEIAQAEGVTCTKFVNYWLHAEHLKVENAKMSKSKGNFYTLRDLKEFNPLAVRYLLISSHYRAKMNFTMDGLKQAETTVKNYNDFLKRFDAYTVSDNKNPELLDTVKKQREDFIRSLDDDLNISKALGHMFITIREMNSAMNKNLLDSVSYKEMEGFIGDINSIIAIDEAVNMQDIDVSVIEKLLEERREARLNKNYKRSDEIRDELAGMNIVIQDGKDKTTWYVNN